MKLICTVSAFLGLAAASAPPFVPFNIDRDSLTTGAALSAFSDALSKDGLVSISNVDTDFATIRRDALTAAHACAHVSSSSGKHTFADGTKRTTLAAGTGEPLRHNSASAECAEFDAASDRLRALVDEVSAEFAAALAAAFPAQGVLLHGSDEEGKYATLTSVVRHGDNLEHFHTYSTGGSEDDDDAPLALDFHTDQGLFVAFTPALTLGGGGVAGEGGAEDDGAAGTFFVRLRDGSTPAVAFDEGTLVFMMGDGVHQVLNPKLAPGSRAPRPVPHALAMTRGGGDHRAWFGRMFLPPADAVHPAHGLTFGELRAMMIEGGDEDHASVGCSSRGLSARDLAGDMCASNQKFCWHACVNFTDEVSPMACGEAKTAQCVDVYEQVYEKGHGDYFLRCTSHTLENNPVTDPPALPQKDDGECGGEAAWAAFLRPETESETYYEHNVTLGWGCEERNVELMWTVVAGDGQSSSPSLRVKMAYRGAFGWMGFGVSNPGGRHNGMNGAHIAMASVNPMGEAERKIAGWPGPTTVLHGVNEYVIHESGSAFRHWSTPLVAQGGGGAASGRRLDESAVMEAGECFSSMSFETGTVGGVPLNLTADNARNHMLFAVHSGTYMMGYHKRDTRSLLDCDFVGGECTFDVPAPRSWDPPCPTEAPTAEPDPDGDGLGDGAIAGITIASVVLTVTLVMIAASNKKTPSSASQSLTKGGANKATELASV